MFFHVLKIPTKRMVKIVEKYNLTKYPLALGRYTLANLITDYTKQDFADELMKGENQWVGYKWINGKILVQDVVNHNIVLVLEL